MIECASIPTIHASFTKATFICEHLAGHGDPSVDAHGGKLEQRKALLDRVRQMTQSE